MIYISTWHWIIGYKGCQPSWNVFVSSLMSLCYWFSKKR